MLEEVVVIFWVEDRFDSIWTSVGEKLAFDIPLSSMFD